MSKIFDFLFLGTELNASKWEWMSSHNITHVVNVCGSRCLFQEKGIKYLEINVIDSPWEDIYSDFEAAYQFIENVRKEEKGIVLVHCQMSQSRSPTIVLSYVMRYKGWSLSEAFQQVNDIHHQVKPNEGFWQQLARLELELHGKSSMHASQFKDKSLRRFQTTQQQQQLSNRTGRREDNMMEEGFKESKEKRKQQKKMVGCEVS